MGIGIFMLAATAIFIIMIGFGYYADYQRDKAQFRDMLENAISHLIIMAIATPVFSFLFSFGIILALFMGAVVSVMVLEVFRKKKQ